MMETDLLDIRNVDCMELMKEFPDNHFDLAVVDPPYGIGMDGRNSIKKRRKKTQKNGAVSYIKRSNFAVKDWDSAPPCENYFNKLRRVAHNQIIWGANHFISRIPYDSPSWIVWDKVNGTTNQSDCELAWTSHDKSVRKIEFMWGGMFQGSEKCGRVMEGNKKLNEKRIHPTQKPVQIYKWILANYADKGMKILDTHMGSGSSAIACHYAGMHLTACELDEDYFREACERIERETRQTAFL